MYLTAVYSGVVQFAAILLNSPRWAKLNSLPRVVEPRTIRFRGKQWDHYTTLPVRPHYHCDGKTPGKVGNDEVMATLVLAIARRTELSPMKLFLITLNSD